MANRPSSHDISDKRLLLEYHKAFYKLLHLPLDWMPPDNRTFTVCGLSHVNPLCIRMMECPEGIQHCRQLDEWRVKEASRTGQPVVTACRLGFYDAVIPIVVDGTYLGSLCIGQYLREMPTQEDMQAVLAQFPGFGMSLSELAEHYRQTRRLTEEEEEGLIELVQKLGAYICESYGRIQFLESVSHSDAIEKAEQYIQQNYTRRLTVAGIALAIGMSRSHFLHKFAEQTGRSPFAYLNSYRVSQACDLLQKTDLSVTAVSFACGFHSIAQFNRQFRKWTGKSPVAFRKGGGEKTSSAEAPSA